MVKNVFGIKRMKIVHWFRWELRSRVWKLVSVLSFFEFHCSQGVGKFRKFPCVRASGPEDWNVTLTFHPNYLAARNVVLRNFKILQSNLETAPIFPNPPLVSFKRDRNLRNSLVRSSLPSNLEPGTFNCSRKVCNTCPFINSKTHIRGPNGPYQVNDHFDCTTSNIIYCITWTLCNKLCIGESGRKLGDRFREHLLDVKNKGSDLSKPVPRHFNLPSHSHEHMEICGIYLHLGNNETRKRKEQRLIFKLGAFNSSQRNQWTIFIRLIPNFNFSIRINLLPTI